MTESPQTSPEPPSLSLAEQRPGWGEKFLRGHSWGAVLVRIVLYVLMAIAFSTVTILALRFFSGSVSGPRAPRLLFIGEVILTLAVLSAARLMALFERQKMDVYGLPLGAAFGKLFWQGALAGLVEISVLVGLIAAGGGYSFGALEIHGWDVARWAGFWALFMVVVGVFEEFLFRGYVQYTLGKRFGFWPAAFLLSALFGAAHLSNKGESWTGVANVVVVGLMLCLSLERTGSLWFAVGLHASFNFGQTFLYSVPNSGFVAPGHLSQARLYGPAWLTGGTVGPEGSLFSFLTMGLLAYAIHRLYPAKPPSRPAA